MGLSFCNLSCSCDWLFSHGPDCELSNCAGTRHGLKCLSLPILYVWNGVPWQTALGELCFRSGLLLPLACLKYVKPLSMQFQCRQLSPLVRYWLVPGIGFALKNAGIIVDNPATLVGLGDLK